MYREVLLAAKRTSRSNRSFSTPQHPRDNRAEKEVVDFSIIWSSNDSDRWESYQGVVVRHTRVAETSRDDE
jgi:hypothetical protein